MPIAIDPRISFGRPVVVSRGISTATIADRIDAGETVDAWLQTTISPLLRSSTPWCTSGRLERCNVAGLFGRRGDIQCGCRVGVGLNVKYLERLTSPRLSAATATALGIWAA